MSTKSKRPAIEIGGSTVQPGEEKLLNLPVAVLYTHNRVEMPVHVIHGKTDGPKLFVSAAIHGDELNGIEIIRRLRATKALKQLKGTLILVPVVNVFGVLNHSRYLPDRRDLNRSFPGSEKGSLAARLADLFMSEIVAHCEYGIDLHTAAIHRSNLPQIRANLEDDETNHLANTFGVPVVLNADLRDGSLRQAASENGVTMLLYEAGEALRFDEIAIRGGVSGILNVMRELGMLVKSRRPHKRTKKKPVVARSSKWIRAPQGGMLRAHVKLGDQIEPGDILGVVDSPLGDQEIEVRAEFSGIVIGRSNLPLVNEGDALFHIARFSVAEADAVAAVEAFQDAEGVATDSALFDISEREII